MSKLKENFYWLIALGLIAQAVFVVFSSNAAVSDNYRLSSIQAENDELREQIDILENKIAARRSLGAIQADSSVLKVDEFVPIEEREIVTSAVASL